MCLLASYCYAADRVDPSTVRGIVDAAIQPLVEKNNVPGIAVAVTVDGKNYFYNYGVASKETRQPVTSETLFEIGSLSKTFTATLASYAQRDGKLSLSDSPGKYFPYLRDSKFAKVSLLNLGTHTAGGFPLQVPDEVGNTDQLLDYLKLWQPAYAAGTQRTYSNVSIGMLGMVTAKSMQMSFDDAIEKKLFPELGMTHSYINIPADRMKDYAQGYTKKDAPVRLNKGILGSEAYGIKSSTIDMIRFVDANMQTIKLNEKLQRAITDTHTGYYKSGEIAQDLMWEQYAYPVELKRLLAGNSDAMVTQSNMATEIHPPLPPQENVLINKTGSTNGFAGYVAFIPAKKLGIVILANKNYPIADRVTAAYQILSHLDGKAPPKNQSQAD
ncbi:MAG: class C beta-lactamase [Collimonas sp.]|uniref:class C beta-lactamase n=1 Tax=Collimonas sp. TaxID=1963772 RepID=UPI003265C48F